MRSLLEKSLIYIVGGIFGAIVGYGIVMINFPIFTLTETCQAVVITSIILGILFAIAITEHQQEKILKKNNAVRNETVALITHEMRTGLTSTGWALQMVLDKYKESLSPEDKEMLEGVVKSIGTTIMHSVNLLDISLLDIGKLSIALEQMNLERTDTMFKETLEKFSVGAKRKNINLTSGITLDHHRNVEVDFVRLRIILENILENSMQYTLGEKKDIRVDISNTDKDLIIQVADTGIGIPKSEQSKIFSEFYRAKNARKVLSSGSGIGLYTSAQYVKAHHGAIRFDSTEGVGSTFYVTIPLKTMADVNEFLEKV